MKRFFSILTVEVTRLISQSRDFSLWNKRDEMKKGRKPLFPFNIRAWNQMETLFYVYTSCLSRLFIISFSLSEHSLRKGIRRRTEAMKVRISEQG